jgi:hypothetical protein
MTARRPGRLSRLDAALVPRLGGMIRRIGRAGRRVAGATGPPGRFVARLARRNPTLTAAVVAVAVASGLIVGTGGDQQHAVAPPPLNPQQVLPGNQLGPTSGETVASYEAAAKQRLSELSTSQVGELAAVVDFRSYLTAPAVASVIRGEPGVRLTQAFTQIAPPADGAVHVIPLGPTTDLGVALTTLAAQERKFVRAYRRGVARARTNVTPESLAFIETNRPVAQEAKLAAVGIGANVGCVFAVTVTGPPAQLTALARQGDVRILDPAPPNVASADLRIVPLEPLDTDIVQDLRFPPVAGG